MFNFTPHFKYHMLCFLNTFNPFLYYMLTNKNICIIIYFD
nr:MAG TPA: Nuclear receptor-interacting protein 1 repression 4 [Caudoviricetes sp.]